MIVFRIVKAPYKNDLSGLGAEKYGGRWNSIGMPALYTSENASLAMLETLANWTLALHSPELYLMKLDIPDRAVVFEPQIKSLPPQWKKPGSTVRTQQFGDQFLSKNEFLLMKVPSAVMHIEHNYVINTRHSLFDKIEIVSSSLIALDKRLVQ
jgi:RES domain-containing protein